MAASSNLDPKVLGLLKRHQQAVEKVAGILEQYYNKLKDSPLAELPTEEVTRLSLRNFASLTEDLRAIIDETSLHNKDFASALQQQYDEIKQTKAALSKRTGELTNREAIVNKLHGVYTQADQDLKKITDELEQTRLNNLTTLQDVKEEARLKIERQKQQQSNDLRDATEHEIILKLREVLTEFNSTHNNFSSRFESLLEGMQASDEGFKASDQDLKAIRTGFDNELRSLKDIHASSTNIIQAIDGHRTNQQQAQVDLLKLKIEFDGIIKDINDRISSIATTTYQQNEVLQALKHLEEKVDLLPNGDKLGDLFSDLQLPDSAIRDDIRHVDTAMERLIQTFDTIKPDFQNKSAIQSSPDTAPAEATVVPGMIETLNAAKREINRVGRLIIGPDFNNLDDDAVDKVRTVAEDFRLLKNATESLPSQENLIEAFELQLNQKLEQMATNDSLDNIASDLSKQLRETLTQNNFDAAMRKSADAIDQLLPISVYNKGFDELVRYLADAFVELQKQLRILPQKSDVENVSLEWKANVKTLLTVEKFRERMASITGQIDKLPDRQNLVDTAAGLKHDMVQLSNAADPETFKQNVVDLLKSFFADEVNTKIQRLIQDSIVSRGDLEKITTDLLKRAGLLSQVHFDQELQNMIRKLAGRSDVLDLKGIVESKANQDTLSKVELRIVKLQSTTTQRDITTAIRGDLSELADRISVAVNDISTLRQLNQLLEPSLLDRLRNLPRDDTLATSRGILNAVAPLAKEETVSSLVTRSYFDSIVLKPHSSDSRLAEQSRLPLSLPRESSAISASNISSMALGPDDVEDTMRSMRAANSPIGDLMRREAEQWHQPGHTFQTSTKHPASSPSLTAQPAPKRLRPGPPADEAWSGLPIDYRSDTASGMSVDQVKGTIDRILRQVGLLDEAYMRSLVTMDAPMLDTAINRLGDLLTAAQSVLRALESSSLVNQLQDWDQQGFSAGLTSADTEDARKGMQESIQRRIDKMVEAKGKMDDQHSRLSGRVVVESPDTEIGPSTEHTSVDPFQATSHEDDQPGSGDDSDTDDDQDDPGASGLSALISTPPRQVASSGDIRPDTANVERYEYQQGQIAPSSKASTSTLTLRVASGDNGRTGSATGEPNPVDNGKVPKPSGTSAPTSMQPPQTPVRSDTRPSGLPTTAASTDTALHGQPTTGTGRHPHYLASTQASLRRNQLDDSLQRDQPPAAVRSPGKASKRSRVDEVTFTPLPPSPAATGISIPTRLPQAPALGAWPVTPSTVQAADSSASSSRRRSSRSHSIIRTPRAPQNLIDTDDYKRWASALAADQIRDMIKLPPDWTAAKIAAFDEQWTKTCGKSSTHIIVSRLDHLAKGVKEPTGFRRSCIIPYFSQQSGAKVETPGDQRSQCPTHRKPESTGYCLEAWFASGIQYPFGARRSVAPPFDDQQVTSQGIRWFFGERRPFMDSQWHDAGATAQAQLMSFLRSRNDAPSEVNQDQTGQPGTSTQAGTQAAQVSTPSARGGGRGTTGDRGGSLRGGRGSVRGRGSRHRSG